MSLPTFSSTTTADEVAATFSANIREKNVLITGTSLNGLGFETARVIAKYANLVIITGYNVQRLALSEEAIKRDVPSANIRCLSLNLSSLSDVRTAAAEVNAYPEPLHVLIHNAAKPVSPFELTTDGLESQMATDHIGPFLFIKLLMPKLLAAGTAPRVVFLSSSAHAAGTGVNFKTFGNPDPTIYHPFETYFQAKSANILTAIELSKRSNGRINAYSVHPGVIYTNILQKEESLTELQAFDILGPDGKPNTDKFEWKTIPQGAASSSTKYISIPFGSDISLVGVPGVYICDSNEANKEIAPSSCDPDNAEKLWSMTEEIIGEKFTF
ncbi:NAD-P-binding protein [Mycena alexandri]|uniref:NAD-P-binding protein n=1 Tax=Mycena alexandri TaxID=1745969 RepID=A0AAD6SMW8_9AGAR|nr:NAD-P-binding protein [Mycena alexandri]